MLLRTIAHSPYFITPGQFFDLICNINYWLGQFWRIMMPVSYQTMTSNLCIFRASPTEFVIPFAKYQKAVYSNQLSLGMRFRMMFETEELGTRRYLSLILMFYCELLAIHFFSNFLSFK
jgi:hypothetical protein